jgi:hypothetical protein
VSAIIIDLAEWLMAHGRKPTGLPKADEVAAEYLDWLRAEHPSIAPQTAAAMIGQRAWTWARVRRLYAKAWRELPQAVRWAAQKE